MFTPDDLLPFLQNLTPSNRFVLALSGGLDSQVLLHALASLFRERDHLNQLHAIHIHHGLSVNADSWAQHCRETCRQLEVSCEIIAVNAKPFPGQSPEEAARIARYTQFAQHIAQGDYLLTAHHQDDQAETLLLQLFRGAGLKGLASMPQWTPFAKGYHLRPLLDVTRADLTAYAKQHRLRWVDDESNSETRYDRNYIRHELMPRIKQRWPSIEKTLARSAQHCAQGQTLLEELADQDFAAVQGKTANTLSIRQLKALSKPRCENVLRRFFQRLNNPLPSRVQLQQIYQNVIHCEIDRKPCMRLGDMEIRRYRDDLYAIHPAKKPIETMIPWDLTQPLKLSCGKVLTASLVKGKGIRQSLVTDSKVEVFFRTKGERCQPRGRIGSHPLKKLMQEWAIPPWERNQIPLLYIADKLAQVVGYCICEPFAAGVEELGWVVLT